MNVAQTARACPFLPSMLRLNEKEREDTGYENLGIWNMVGLRAQKVRGNYYHERDARTNLGGRENGDGCQRETRKRTERWGEGGGGQVLLNENNSPLSSRLEGRIPGETRREGDVLEEEARPKQLGTARSEKNEDKRRPRGMQVRAKLT